MPRPNVDRPLRIVGSALAGWEFVAIATGRLPTISQVCRRARRHPVGRAVVAGICLWLALHLSAEL
jgi:hypothetical protein